jgi:hypothetical protein
MHRLIGPAFALVVVSVLSWVVVGCASTDGSVTDRSQGLASQWLQTVTGSQRDILKDLEVTTPEYDQALNTARACIEAQGFGTSNIRLVGDKVRHDFIVRPEGKSTDAALKALFDCRQRSRIGAHRLLGGRRSSRGPARPD